MSPSVQVKAQSIYNKFSKAPILEMVQYMVDHNVDAQILNELKLIDSKMHKNSHVKSYGEKIYDSYERICKVLVTYPSLEFKNSEFRIKKDKESQFVLEYFGQEEDIQIKALNNIIDIVNISLSNCIESNHQAERQIEEISKNKKNIDRLSMLIKEASGEDYSNYIQCIADQR